jgi:nucleoside-diphosphate-sugar epimerase
MRLFVTGGSGALGKALVPAAQAAGHEVVAPRHADLDLFDPAAVAAATSGADAILHLATRIRSLDQLDDLPAWRENDRLRTEASRILVDVALANGVQTYVQPSITFLEGLEDDPPPTMRSAVDSERETARFAESGRRGVVLRLGQLDGPGTGNDAPAPDFGSTLHVADAADALLAALELESGTYNVCRDGERVSNRRLKDASHWRPRR